MHSEEYTTLPKRLPHQQRRRLQCGARIAHKGGEGKAAAVTALVGGGSGGKRAPHHLIGHSGPVQAGATRAVHVQTLEEHA